MDKFLEMMKMPLNIGNAVIEGGQVGLNGGNPLLATASKLESVLKQPLTVFPLQQGAQLPQPPMAGQLTALPAQLMAPLQQFAPPMSMGSEYVGQKSDISSGKNVQTTIF